MGMHRLTGQSIDPILHVYQSIAEIISTAQGTRVMRRDFGSRIPFMLDGNITPALILRIYAEAARSLHRWEPRIQLKRVQLERADHDKGFLQLILTGDIFANRLTPGDSVAVARRETIEFSIPAVLEQEEVTTVGFSGDGLLVRPNHESLMPEVVGNETRLTLSQVPSTDMPIQLVQGGYMFNPAAFSVVDQQVVIAEDMGVQSFDVYYFVEVGQ